MSIEDLLGREKVKPKLELLKKNIIDKNILVTGCGGSIGSELCHQILKNKPKVLYLFDHSEYLLHKLSSSLNFTKSKIVSVLGTVQSEETIKMILKNNIDTVFHAAAYKHVPLVEENIVESIKTNIFGTYNLVKYAQVYGVKNFILISTDKAVRPTNFMGATKRFSELICKAFYEKNKSTLFNCKIWKRAWIIWISCTYLNNRLKIKELLQLHTKKYVDIL